MDISDKEFASLVSHMYNNYGINLKEKRVLVCGRLQSVVAKYECADFAEYFDMVNKDMTMEMQFELINKLTTNHTFFAREEAHFQYLRDTVLPFITKDHGKDMDIRIWSAGCSSGEEPYTIAMVIADYFTGKKIGWDTKILATDISGRVLEVAKVGIYPEEQLKLVSDTYKKCYFHRTPKGEYQVNEDIRKEVIFRSFNLMNEHFPFKKKFHLIFCRNVMIYFDKETKQKLVKKYYDNLVPGGYLFIGHSETLNGLESEFKYVKPSIYRKL